MNNQKIDGTYQQNENEFSLTILFNSFAKKIKIISIITFFSLCLGVLFNFQLPPQNYLINIKFTKPTQNLLLSIQEVENNNNIDTNSYNQLSFENTYSESLENIYSDFLSNVNNVDLQFKIFNEGDYKSRFEKNNKEINVKNLVKSILISNPPSKKTLKNASFDSPFIISIEGDEPEILSDYLSELLVQAEIVSSTKLKNNIYQTFELKLKTLTKEREKILDEESKNLLLEINLIIEQDAQKIREILDEIEILRYSEKQKRLNEIVQLNTQVGSLRAIATEKRLNDIVKLSAAASIAKSLGIIENNFNPASSDGMISNLRIAIDVNKELPQWYLYGEKALLKRIQLLKTRSNDDPFIPEIVSLKNKIQLLESRTNDDPFIPQITSLNANLLMVRNNQLLQTLKDRKQNDLQFLNIIKINYDINKLKKNMENLEKNMELANFNFFNLNASPLYEEISQHKNIILIIAFILGLFLSVIVVLILNILKREQRY